MSDRIVPLITRDPATGAQLIVTRLTSPDTGITIEGNFDLGWIGRLTREQLDFVGLLLKYRTNLQKLADELGIAYNTVRSRLDDIVTAIGEEPPSRTPASRRPDPGERRAVLDRVASGDMSVDEAIAELKRQR